MKIPVESISEPQFELSVDGEQWKRVASLDCFGPDDQVYTLDAESGKVAFGDGATGRILRAGSSIRARYRYGEGAEGNLGNGPTITLTWTPTSFLKNQIIGAIIEPQVDGINFKVCRGLQDPHRRKSLEVFCNSIMSKDVYRKKCVNLSFSDLALSVLPWPFRKKLPKVYCGENSENTFWDLFLLVLCKPAHNIFVDGNDNENTERHKNRIYIVKSTDTLESIAQNVYQDPTKWTEIAKANGIDDPRTLTPGTTLHIPALDE